MVTQMGDLIDTPAPTEGPLRSKTVQYAGTAAAASFIELIRWVLLVLGSGTALAPVCGWWVPGLYALASAVA